MSIQDKIKELETNIERIKKRCYGYSKLSDQNACLDYNSYFSMVNDLKKLIELRDNDLN